MIHYKKHCKLIPESDKNIILGKEHGEEKNITLISVNINNEKTGPLTSQEENILNSVGLIFLSSIWPCSVLECSSIFHKSYFEHARKLIISQLFLENTKIWYTKSFPQF